MPEQKLRDTLTELQRQLADTESLTNDDLAMLEAVHDRIDRLLEQTQETRREEMPAVQAEVGGTLRRFEQAHPDLTRILGVIAETLSSIGI